jgi:hypothetical protein
MRLLLELALFVVVTMAATQIIARGPAPSRWHWSSGQFVQWLIAGILYVLLAEMLIRRGRGR